MLFTTIILLTIAGIATLIAATAKGADTAWGGQVSGGITLGVIALATVLGALAWRDPVGAPNRIYGVLQSGPLVAVGTIILGVIALLVTAGVMANPGKFKTGITELYAFVIFTMLGGIIMIASQNLLVLYLGLELSSYCTYILVGYYRDDRYSTEAASKYFLLGAIGSAFLLFGMSLVYGGSNFAQAGSSAGQSLAGVLDYAGIGQAVTEASSLNPLIWPGLAMVLVGFGFKLALVPFHSWTPDAYQGAPSMVAALLSVGPKAAVVIALSTLLNTAFPTPQLANAWQQTFMWLAILSMTVGNLQAIQQNNIKRLLGYSSIAQLGYVVIGIAAGSSAGTAALIFYMAGYAISNIGAFATISALRDAGVGEEIKDYAGLVKRNPTAAVLLGGFFMSLAGVPLLAGFLGKVFVFKSAVDAGLIALAVVAVLNTVVAYYYYFRVVIQAFLAEPQDATRVELNPTFVTVLAVALIAVLALGTFPGPVLDGIAAAVKTLPALVAQK